MSDYIMDEPQPFKQQKHAPAAPTAIKPSIAAPAKDLSRQIEQSVKREPLDAVRCIRVFGDFYRCNWWSPASDKRYDNPLMSGLLVTTHVVRLSRRADTRRGDARRWFRLRTGGRTRRWPESKHDRGVVLGGTAECKRCCL